MGVVALGDSLVDADQSWAYWLSRAMGLPLRRVSAGGSLSRDVLRQLPELRGGRYDVACLTVGTNDILLDWDRDAFADNLATIVGAAKASADRVVAPTISLGLASFPGTGAEFRRRVVQANSVIHDSGVLVVSGSDLRGPRTMSADRIHPTATGQLVLADRAAELFGVSPLPSSLDEGARRLAWRDYYAVGARQVPRRVLKRALGRPLYRAPEADG
jgi:hypothetical protein